jgi:peptide/nickel transport system ATP-binding protein
VSSGILLDGVSRWFPGAPKLVAVDDVSLRLEAGRVLGIVGESGCGKTTLARLVLGLLAPSEGQIWIAGAKLSTLDRRARARLIQPVFQDPYQSLNPQHLVRDIVGLPLAVQGVDDVIRPVRVMEALEQVGLSPELALCRPSELSGGQRQRVAIARAVILRPSILVLDEPTSALDVSVQAQILNLLAGLQSAFGLTMIVISHNLAVVEHLATELAVMYLGRIVEHAPTEALLTSPKHPYTRALLASVLTPEPGLGLPDIALGEADSRPTAHPTRLPLAPALPDCGTALPGGDAKTGDARREDGGVSLGRGLGARRVGFHQRLRAVALPKA